MKKVLSLLLVVVMLCSTFAGLQISSHAISSSGSCGNNVSYSFDFASGTLTISGNGVMTDYTISNSPFRSQSGIKTLIIENGVTSIGNGAFSGCSRLTSVTIPDSVTSIGSSAFFGCSSLTSITIGNSVKSIGIHAFWGCSGLTSITIASGNPNYDSRNNCNAIIETATNTLITGCKNTMIPDSVTSISDGAFACCNGLIDVTIPDSVTSIGDSAFYGCSGLTSISIPDSVTSIGSYAFDGCSGLTSITIPNSVTSIGNGAFSGCSRITSVTIPDSVTSIPYGAFSGCSGLKNVDIGNSVTSIVDNAFERCRSLTSITIPKSVEIIGYYAFVDCTELRIVRYCSIPEQWNCINVEDMEIFFNISTAFRYARELKIYYNYDPHHEHCYDAGKTKVYPNTLGYVTYTCQLCGDTYKGAFTAPIGKLALKHSARTVNAIKVQWNNVKTASGYQVQISTKDGKKWSTYATLKAGVTNYTFKNLAAGNNYKFRVRFYIKAADGKNYYSPWSATLNSPTLPKGTAVKLTTAKKAFTAKWTKVAGVTGYQVQYSTNAKFTKALTKTMKGAAKVKLAVKSLKGGAKYYVRIRTYKTIGGKNYFSAWSAAKAVTTKK